MTNNNATASPMMNMGGSMPMPMQPQPNAPMMNMGGGMPMPMQPQQPTFEDGGATPSKTNPIKEFFSDINVVEAGIMALGVAAFIYAIYYYKFEMTMTKTGYADLNARLQKIEVEEGKRKTAEMNASGGKMKKKRMLI
jgi:hypothetical protein